MIVDLRSAGAPGQWQADVAIVGAGAAGIAIALELAAAGKRVVLVEAGGHKFSRESQTHYRAETVSPDTHFQVDMFRRRVFGGSTSVWGGRCIPFDPIDFEDRPWMEKARWPITHATFAGYLPRALEYLLAGPAKFSAGEALPGEPAPMVPGVTSPDVVLDRIERFSLPVDCAAEYGRKLADSERITVLLNAPVEMVTTTTGGTAVTGLRIRTAPDAAPVVVSAPRVVLAAGGLEIPRLLLLSDEECPQGLGNGRDLVGRYYQCHIEGEFGTIRFDKPADGVRQDYQRSPEGIYCRRYIWLSPETQRREKLAGLVLRPFHANIVDPGHRHPVLSAMYLVKNHVVPEYARKLTSLEDQLRQEMDGGSLAFWGGHARNMVRGAPKLAAFGLDWARRRTFARRKLPSVVLRDPRETYPIEINAEQEPNRDSRIVLGRERDALGHRRIRVDWRTTEGDHLRLVEGLRRLQAAFEGTPATYSLTPADYERAMAHKVPVGGHYIGTARMADDPADGVCDADCQVHGTHGLYLAGAAVFPTSGFANPTLTLVALALRLADHLKGQGADSSKAAQFRKREAAVAI